MSRIVKEYDERKIDFMQATREFFFTIGYAKMSVQMLTTKVGVAKGTFYHYFKSKEDLLSQWVIHEMAPVIAHQKEIAADKDLNAITKLSKILKQGRDWKIQHMDMIIPLLRTIHDNHNILLRTEMTRQSANLSQPIFAQIIRQGVAEGVFTTEYPEEIARKLPRIAQLFAEDLATIILDHHDGNPISFEEADKIIAVWQESIERILGAAKGSILFVDRTFLKAMLDQISPQSITDGKTEKANLEKAQSI